MKTKKGDIFYTTWGYEQTNAKFFQVIDTTSKSVKIREIDSKETESPKGSMSGHAIPIRNKFIGTKKTKRIRNKRKVKA